MRSTIRITLAALTVIVLGGLSVIPTGRFPRFGPFLDPVGGIWSVAGQARVPAEQQVALASLTDAVDVLIDQRGVPHVFAASEEDAYRVMGYLQARDRLFQLELMSRAGSGTLTELVGESALSGDRTTREFGLPWGAERKFSAVDSTSAGYHALVAFSEGVNSFIDGAGKTGIPLEYHLLGRSPSRWDPINSFHLFGRMGMTLALGDPARARLAVQGLVGAEAAAALVPLNNPIQEPIQPSNRRGPRYAFRTIPPPGPPDSVSALRARMLPTAFAAQPLGDGGGVGSNNWAVAPSRTQDGFALLSGDPHLGLSLPSIWYEIHLVVPGRLDVAGVALPGAPGVVIGLNRDLAWTFTNTGGDVLDLYAETVDDSISPSRYLLDGEWRPLELRIERYRNPRGEVLATDTLRFTHRGPMQHREGQWLSLRWTVNEPSFEADLFLRAGKARNAEQWLQTMRGYVAPTQNGLVADRAGTIAIRSSGAYPVRPDDGRGDLIRDGATSAADWTGTLPVEEYPFSINPSQGFLVSANQQPVDPLDNSRYLGANWISPWRALQINRLLRADPNVTPDRMRQYQTHTGSAHADAFVPFMLDAGRVARDSGIVDPQLLRAQELLSEWDRTYGPDDQRAILFELAVGELTRRTWDELKGADERLVFTPAGSTLRELLADSESVWWDDRGTAVRETRDDILTASLMAALDTAIARYGAPEGGDWTWSRIRNANIYHLLGLPGLSALGLPVRGGPTTISPLSGRGTAGASWRMVVELGEQVRAWATYPGGQSGNPSSRWYTDRLPQWVAGELAPVYLPRTPSDLPDSLRATRIIFSPGAAP